MGMCCTKQEILLDKIKIVGFKRFKDDFIVDFNERSSVLVGDNCSGKSTILEAIHLALSGQFRNEPIGRAISPFLFNLDRVEEFIELSGTERCKLPTVSIEVFLKSSDNDDLFSFDGGVNSDHIRRTGFVFRIEPMREHFEDLQARVQSEHYESLPIEYYAATWTTFSNAPTSPLKLPIRSVFINPGGAWKTSGADERAVRSILECLDPEIVRSIAGDVRTSKDCLESSTGFRLANSRFDDVTAIDGGKAKLAARELTKDSWIKDLTIQVDEIPFSHIGSGSQCILQAQVAARRGLSAKKSMILLFEEPENHLSHAHLRMFTESILRPTDRQAVYSTHSSYVANKLDLGNLLLVPTGSAKSCSRLSDLSQKTRLYFEKLAGFDTLRLVLADRSILVEGPSEELIVQRLYRDSHDGRLPIHDGIEIICINGLSFKRFLELAVLVNKRVAVLTDNDGNLEALEKKYKEYSGSSTIRVCYSSAVRSGVDGDGVRNWNTLEPELVAANGVSTLAELFGRTDADEAALIKYMESNKTDCALTIFNASERLICPNYIDEAFEWVEK